MASTYTMVAYGSQGNAVKALQSQLNKRGYGLDEDGIFGKKTQAAVRDYQKKSGLTMVDGIAGDETWGSLMGIGTAGDTASNTLGLADLTAEPVAEAKVTESTRKRLAELEQGYRPSDEVLAALAYRDSVAAAQPDSYRSRFEEALEALYDQIAAREAFSYDPTEDALSNSYVKLYTQQGAAAMEDTLGQAAALTGGYGSSYAQTAGQQAYNRYLSQLAALVPELQQAALAAYQQEEQALSDRYSLLSQREKTDYSRWQDTVDDWQKALNAAQQQYEDLDSSERKAYETLLAHYADKAQQERKLTASGAYVSDSTNADSGGSRESLSSTAADSLYRAMSGYLKAGKRTEAQSLLEQYAARMTPAQRKRFSALFGQYEQA